MAHGMQAQDKHERSVMCVSVQVQEDADVSAGGVLLPITAKEKPIAGTVVRTGPGKLQEDGSRKAPRVGFCTCMMQAAFTSGAPLSMMLESAVRIHLLPGTAVPLPVFWTTPYAESS